MSIPIDAAKPHLLTRTESTDKPNPKEQILCTKVMQAAKESLPNLPSSGFTKPTSLRSSSSALLTETLKPKKFEGVHTKATQEKGGEYPERFHVPKEKVSWQTPFDEYQPIEYTSPKVLAGPIWADPADFSKMKGKSFESFQGTIRLDFEGKPLNPVGRTGLTGRGLLGKWGANQAGDPVVTRIHPTSGALEILLIQRKDNGQWAIPGGMQDPGELISTTAKRELEEETGAQVDYSSAPIIYQGYVDDPRNTDNAWMETSVIHVHLKNASTQTIEAGSDAQKAQWHPITKGLVDSLYASHPHFVQLTLQSLDESLISSCSNVQEIQELQIDLA